MFIELSKWGGWIYSHFLLLWWKENIWIIRIQCRFIWIELLWSRILLCQLWDYVGLSIWRRIYVMTNFKCQISNILAQVNVDTRWKQIMNPDWERKCRRLFINEIGYVKITTVNKYPHREWIMALLWRTLTYPQLRLAINCWQTPYT